MRSLRASSRPPNPTVQLRGGGGKGLVDDGGIQTDAWPVDLAAGRGEDLEGGLVTDVDIVSVSHNAMLSK